MAENSKIEWTDHTFNPWIGCTKVSPGCAHCYAETLMDTRYGRVKWGKGQPRSKTAVSNWKEPIRWNHEYDRALEKRDAALEVAPPGSILPPSPTRPRVFCASLADWLDEEVPIEWLADLLELIWKTPNLDWLLLTKRPQNWKERLDQVLEYLPIPEEDDRRHHLSDWILDWYNDKPPANIWVGTTVEDQQRYDERIEHLCAIPARIRFLSMEPLLGEVDLNLGANLPSERMLRWYKPVKNQIHWVIAGGESGPGARPVHVDWVRSIRDQCEAAGVAFLFKQWGEWIARSQYLKTPSIDLARGLMQSSKSAVMRRDGGIDASLGEAQSTNDADSAIVCVGKKLAGRHLDGVEHNAFPKAA